MVIYFLSVIILAASLLVYFRLAVRYGIVDKPNERSSHSQATIRGAGILFPIAAMLWFVFKGFPQPWMIAGLLIVAVVSFTDDLVTLSGSIRLAAQVIAITLMFIQMHLFGLAWYILIPLYIAVIGWINAFNFMDGINAITPFYSLVSLGTFLYMASQDSFFDRSLLVLLILAMVIFSFFNARRRARAFAGDVGSVSMAYLLAFLLLSLTGNTGRWEYSLFFLVYATDAVFTILIRLRRRENIFRAHRSHLYQLLSNELGWPHLLVALLYAVVQLAINILIVVLIRQGMMSLVVFLVIVAALSLVYLGIRWFVGKRSRSF